MGLVKVSLHQFYLAFSDVNAQHLYKQAKVPVNYITVKLYICCILSPFVLWLQLPVVAMDSYCPIVNPFCGNVIGHLAVLCALGTSDQVFMSILNR